MMTTLTRAPISKTELLRISRLPEYSGSKLEVWDGDLYVVKPSPQEPRLKTLLLRLLREQYQAHPIGYILQDAQIDLPGAHTILQPAFSIVNARQPGYNWDRSLGIMPACVIEIAGRDESPHHLRAKAEYYRHAGCLLPILLEPAQCSAEVLTAAGFYRFGASDILEGGTALPGFRVSVWRLFAA